MASSAQVLIGLVGSVVTLGLFLISVTFRMGHHAARIEQLEKWRDNIRLDMHEISDHIQALGKNIAEIKTMLEERTERRHVVRD